jgi:hypothetical protein
VGVLFKGSSTTWQIIGNIKGKMGFVIGSQTPWFEGILLAMGATKVNFL